MVIMPSVSLRQVLAPDMAVTPQSEVSAIPTCRSCLTDCGWDEGVLPRLRFCVTCPISQTKLRLKT